MRRRNFLINMNKLLVILFFILNAVSISKAQNYRETTTNTNLWLMYFGNHKFSNNLGLHAEAQVRRHDVVSEWQQLLLRVGLDIYTSQARFTIGYGFIETYPYGEFPVANAFPEHRIWQQLLLPQTWGRARISHRYRLEQRLLGNAATGEFRDGRYENRARYMFRSNIALQGNTIDPGEIYVAFYDEIMINFGKEVRYNIFDQNRLYGALGYHLGRLGTLELGYLLHTVKQRNLFTAANPPRNIMENNHTIQIGLFSNLSFIRPRD
ncbi:DUF2490 domain-containing protein [soil metagenome]